MPKKKLSCHCGGVEGQVEIPETGFKKIMRCNCSICKRKGYIIAVAGPNDFKITKGEDKSLAIALASIMAKVFRDTLMIQMSLKFPEYGLDKNKGYGTKQHYDAIEKHGIKDFHRKTFLKRVN